MRGALPSDQVREIMGAANLSSTAELKAARKAAKASYAAELQAQMRANEEAKVKDRMERLGIARPPPLQAPPPGGLPGGGGAVSPGAMGGGMMGFGQASPPGAPLGPYPQAAPPAFPPAGPGPVAGMPLSGSPGRGAAPPPPLWNQPLQYQLSPPPYQPSMQQPYQPGGPLGNLYGMPPPNPSPPPPFGGANGYGPQPPGYSSSPQPGFGPVGVGGGFGPAPGGGYALPAPPPPPPPPLLPGPAPPPGPGRDTMHRLEQQAKKDQYRLELEAQIREREERKASEKARQREEDMRKEAEMAAAARDAMGRGGGGAPLRDAAGNVVANLRGAMGGMGPPQGLPSPGGMGMMPMGMGPMMQQQPPPPLMGSPPGMGMGIGIGMGGPPPPPPQQPPMMGGPALLGSPSGMGPPLGMMGALGAGGGGPMDAGPPGVLPNYRFRSDNAYLTPKELDNKQRQMRELQEALEQQIQEKRRAKELEKHREIAEIEREEARFRAGLEQQRGGGQEGGAGAGGEARSKEEVLADAWEKARQEAEELRRNKFASKRGAGGVSHGPGGGGGGGRASPGAGGRGGGSWVDGADEGSEAPPPMATHHSAPAPQAGGGFGDVFSPPMAAPVAGRPSTPMVVEKVRQVAAAELAAVKQELAAEAAQLREVVAAQGQQVAALKTHAERMEAEAERAREQVTAMRLGLIQQRSGPEFDPDHALAAVPPGPLPPALVDIDLDLPPTGAMLRRNAAPTPVYDMGPAIPAVNSSVLMVDNAAASAINASAAAAAPGAGGPVASGRPPSRLRAVNPLEASMAGESVFIYPNGREMARQPNGVPTRPGGAPLPQALSPGGPLPFQSIHLAGGVGAGGADLPTLVTVQELEPGPVPPTPQGGALASSTVMLGSTGPASSGYGAAAASVNASVAAAPMTVSVASSAAACEATGGAAAGPRQQSISPEGRRAAASATPLDVDMVMSRNKEKLEMLKGITDLAVGAASVEALDEFLARYAAQRPGLPERTATPVLRICTPAVESAGAPTPAAAELPALRNGSLPSSTPLYSSRTKSVGPLPMGAGHVMPVGGVSIASSAGGNSTLSGSCGGSIPGSTGGGGGGSSIGGNSGGGGGSGGGSGGAAGYSTHASNTRHVSGDGGTQIGGGTAAGNGRRLASPPGALGTGRVSRRNSFTGERSPQEGVLSQLLEPASRPKTGPEAGSASGVRAPSPMAGRPPMLPNNRYSNNGSRVGTPAAGATSGYVPSCASRPASGATSAALPPSRPTRTATRGSEDGSAPATSAWPSYNPSRESSAGGTRMSRSRSLSAQGEIRPGKDSAPVSTSQREHEEEPRRPEPLPLPPPPEDTLDVEMRKGLGAAAAAPPTPPSAGPHSSLPGTPVGKGSNQQLGTGDSGIPPFQIPRSPMLAGARRTGSAASQRGSGGP